MKKFTFLIAIILMVFVSNIAFAQDDDIESLKPYKGNWDFSRVEIDKQNTANATQTAKIKAELTAKYNNGVLSLRVPALTFSFFKDKKMVSGKVTFSGENIILTKEDGSVTLNGKLYDFNEMKNIGISFTEKGVKVNLIFEK